MKGWAVDNIKKILEREFILFLEIVKRKLLSLHNGPIGQMLPIILQ